MKCICKTSDKIWHFLTHTIPFLPQLPLAPLLHPGQFCSVVERNDPAGPQNCFFFLGGGLKGEYFYLPVL